MLIILINYYPYPFLYYYFLGLGMGVEDVRESRGDSKSKGWIFPQGSTNIYELRKDWLIVFTCSSEVTPVFSSLPFFHFPSF